MTTLVSFLGNRPYEEATYIAPDTDNCRVTTRYVARALAEFYDCSKVDIVATEVAWKANGEGLSEALENLGLTPTPHIIPDGRNENELREQFRVLRDLLATQTDELVLDITHGFRHQPFFAAAALAVLLAADELPEKMHIVYGALEAGSREYKTAPILDISHFITLMRLAFGISIFLKTGHGDVLVEALRHEEAHLRERKLQGEREEFPDSNKLIGAVERFSADLAAMRVPALLLGKKNGRSSAALLRKALQSYRQHCDRDHPALVPLLDDLENMIAPLEAKSLFGQEGQKAMASLGKLYLQFSRYAEAAGLGAEGLICRYADSRAATDAGRPIFDMEKRNLAKDRCSSAKENRSKLDIRNDLLHCGFRAEPQPADALCDNVSKLVDLIATPPRTIFVTRHAGAREWAERQGIIVDEMVEHLDPEIINPGDLVIGTLPVHLVAEICRRGGRYKHLSMNIPPEHRGRELSADDMEKFGATLQEFQVTPVARERDEDA